MNCRPRGDGNKAFRVADTSVVERSWSDWSRGLYPHGVVCGLLMVVWSFLVRNWDAPIPLIAVILFIPYYALSGFLVARREGSTNSGLVAGAATATAGYVIVFVATLAYSAINDPWPTLLAWALFGLTFVLTAVVLGAACGAAGAALARFIASWGT